MRQYLAQLAPLPPQVIPTLKQLGFAADALDGLRVTPGVEGGEALFEDFKHRINRYHETRDFPAIKGPSYLSVHLRFGTVSLRELAAYAHHRGGEGANTWLSELVWRDFYAQILWHRPDVAEQASSRNTSTWLLLMTRPCLSPGVKAAPATRWWMPPCASSIRPVICTTGCAW